MESINKKLMTFDFYFYNIFTFGFTEINTKNA